MGGKKYNLPPDAGKKVGTGAEECLAMLQSKEKLIGMTLF